MKFSERYGYVPVRSALQTGDIDNALRNRLWNLVREMFLPDVPPYAGTGNNDYLPTHRLTFFFEHLFEDYFKRAVDEIGTSYFNEVKKLREYFFGCPWYEVYDLIEFLADAGKTDFDQKFIRLTNDILKQEMSGYRFVSDHIAQITSEEEIKTIEQALDLPDSLKPVREHLSQSLRLLSDRKKPDYRNSIKESISAVESLAKIISKQNKATLSPALNAVEKKTKLHSVLKEAFQKLYGYTSDAQGIRHGLMDEPTLDAEDAKFMLVSCSAFVNYLVVKAQKAGIKI
jgi:AbiJ N-terminal domain 4